MAKLSWRKFAEIAQIIGPMILVTVNPALAPIAGKITQAIVEAEGIKGASGKQKAEQVKKIIKLALESANAVDSDANVDVEAIDEALGDGITAVISTIRVIEGKGKVKVVVIPATV